MRTERRLRREQSAIIRFAIHVDAEVKSWNFRVCDNDRLVGERYIGKFNSFEDAELFLEACRKRFVNEVL